MTAAFPIVSHHRGGPDFLDRLDREGLVPLRRARPSTLQLNLGKRCNQACHHCHVDAGPKRTEMMDERTALAVLALLDRSSSITHVDITGGAPELSPHFRLLVQGARKRGLQVMNRCNLTVLLEPGQEDLAAFLADHRVQIVASLPCYGPENVDKQRGKGVFDASIEALRRLNALGYGDGSGELLLDLVYNPGGAFLPPAQAGLEVTYKRHLHEDFGITFDRLLTLANMPISRFARSLEREGRLASYTTALVEAFNPGTVGGLMCRHLLSVDWRGRLYDCDFNQMLEVGLGSRRARTIFELEGAEVLEDEPIAVDSHCFGCTAGAGSSCGGALD